MFIFDSDQSKKTIHGMRLLSCKKCKGKTSHLIIEEGMFITALESPILPYKRKYYLVCQTCQTLREINHKEFNDLRTFSQYESPSYNTVDNLTSDIKKNKSGKKYCAACGTSARGSAKFCNSCGKSLLT